ncbi:MAG: YihY family inner membrane protein [Deltaproteobacteria bacterium]|nr:YihY family inner membrane protein [Deltaproteobacteria bacterium]
MKKTSDSASKDNRVKTPIPFPSRSEGTQGLIRFLTRDVWRVRGKDLPRSRSIPLRAIRVVILSIRGIMQDEAPLRASALTFYSLLSVVPVVAMIFGIAKGFGFEKNLEKMLIISLEGQEQVVEQILTFSHALLDSVKGGFVAGVGLLVLLYTIIKILSNIESAFNNIWGVKRARSLNRKITDYLSIMLIAPVLIVLSSTMTVLVSSGITRVVEGISYLRVVSPGISLLLSFLPYLSLWILFSFVFIFVPNTKIKFTSGILGGIIAGTLYHIFQWGYIHLQIGVAKYNAIYGSFAALPLFFVWMQLSWLIVLFGAEIAFAHQNVETYEFEQDCLTASHSFKRLLTLWVLHRLLKNFLLGEEPWDASRICHETEIPSRLVNQILHELGASRLVSEVKLNETRVGYEPAQDPDGLTLKSVIEALEEYGSRNIPIARTRSLEKIDERLKAFDELIAGSQANIKLKDL